MENLLVQGIEGYEKEEFKFYFPSEWVLGRVKEKYEYICNSILDKCDEEGLVYTYSKTRRTPLEPVTTYPPRMLDPSEVVENVDDMLVAVIFLSQRIHIMPIKIAGSSSDWNLMAATLGNILETRDEEIVYCMLIDDDRFIKHISFKSCVEIYLKGTEQGMSPQDIVYTMTKVIQEESPYMRKYLQKILKESIKYQIKCIMTCRDKEKKKNMIEELEYSKRSLI